MLFNLSLHAQLNSSSPSTSTELTAWLASMPIVSLDASPSTYHHDHQALFQAMLGVENTEKIPNAFQSRQQLKHGMLSISPHLDDNTVAFSIQNNFSPSTLQQLFDSNMGGNSQSTLYHPNYLKYKSDLPTGSSKQHFWTSHVEKLNQIEHQVHTWPLLTPTQVKIDPTATQIDELAISRLPLLAIGGLESHRLTSESNLNDLRHFFPNHRIEMIKGGHFAHQGIDSPKAAKYVIDHFAEAFTKQ